MMYENLPFTNNRLAAMMADILQSHPDTDDLTAATDKAQSYLGGVPSVQTLEKGLGVGRITYFKFQNLGLLLLNGISNFADGLAIAGSYSTRIQNSPRPATCPTFGRAATSALDLFPWNDLRGLDTLTIAGHSAGGAIGMNVHWALLQTSLPPSIKTITFGSPRPGNLPLARALNQEPICRYFFPNDPLPFAPPSFLEAPATCALVGLPIVRSWGFFYQAGGGRQLSDTGDPQDFPMPQSVTPIADVNLASWMLGASAVRNYRHTIQEYAGALAIYLRPVQAAPQGRVADPNERQEGGMIAPLDPPVIPGQGELDAEFQAHAQKNTRVFSSDLKYYVRRAGVGFAVLQLEVEVCRCTTRKKAQVIATGLNRAARQWDSAPTGDQNALSYTMSNVFLP